MEIASEIVVTGPWPERNDVLTTYVTQALEKGTRPEELDGFTDSDPPAGTVPKIIRRYDVRAKHFEKRDKVRCVFGHPHKNGFVVWAPDGCLRVMGRVCGITHAGDEWRAEMKSYEAAQKHAEALERSGEILRVVPKAIAEVEQFLKEVTLRIYVTQRGHFRDGMVEARNALLECIRGRGGQMYYERSVTVANENPNSAESTKRTTIRDPDFGPIRGRGFVVGAPYEPDEALPAALQALRQARADLEGQMDKLTTREHSSLHQKVMKAARRVQDAAALLRDLQSFLNLSHLANLVQYLNRHHWVSETYSVVSGALVNTDYRLAIPPTYGVPDMPNIDELGLRADVRRRARAA